MARAKWQYAGTNDLVGATVVSVDYDEMTLVKDGTEYRLELESEEWFNTCMCEGTCYCYHGSSSSYFRAQRKVV